MFLYMPLALRLVKDIAFSRLTWEELQVVYLVDGGAGVQSSVMTNREITRSRALAPCKRVR
jgi:hypothetical protein